MKQFITKRSLAGFISKKRSYPLNKLLLYGLFSIILLFPTFLKSQELHKLSNDYVLQRWDIKSGLPQNTINCLFQSKAGFLWIGTPSGLSKFDGHRFQNYSRKNVPELKSDHITALYEDENQILWIGTRGGGLYSFINGIWTFYGLEQGLSNLNIRTIDGDGQGTLWIGSDYGLNKLYKGQFEVLTTRNGLDGNIITALLVLNPQDIWIGTLQGGLAHFDGKKIKLFGIKEDFTPRTIQYLQLDNFFDIYVATDMGAFIYKRQNETFTYLKGTSYTPITSIMSKDETSCYIATYNDGLKIFNRIDEELIHLNLKVQEENIKCLYKDDKDNIWVGSASRGLLLIRPSVVQTFTRNDGLSENSVSCVLKTINGSLIAGMRNSGIAIINKENDLSIINSENGLSGNRISVLYEMKNGDVWVAAKEGGISSLSGEEYKHIYQIPSLTTQKINSIYEDNQGLVWMLTNSQILQFRHGKILHSQELPRKDNEQFRQILETRAGNLLLLSNLAIYVYDNNALERCLMEPDIPNVEYILMYEDEDSLLWIATNGNGVLIYSKENLININSKSGLSDDYIFSIIDDGQGYMWFSSYKGIYKIKKNSLNAYSEGKLEFVHSIIYDEYNGMISRQCNGEMQPSVNRDINGILYFPTVMGIAQINPKKSDYSHIPTIPKLEKVIANGVEQQATGNGIVLENRIQNLEIRYSAAELDFPNRIQYVYILEGIDKEKRIINHTGLKRIEYEDIEAGEYIFTIYAKNNYGEKSGTQTFTINIIHRAYSKRAMTYLGIVLLFLISFSVFYYFKRGSNEPSRELFVMQAEESIQKYKVLVNYIESETPFLNPDLTVKDLAQKIHINSNTLSFLINDNYGGGFNEFINTYRIGEAKKKLQDEQLNEKSILEIMYDCGFYSKSVFNTAFKKHCGMTPSAFRKSIK